MELDSGSSRTYATVRLVRLQVLEEVPVGIAELGRHAAPPLPVDELLRGADRVAREEGGDIRRHRDRRSHKVDLLAHAVGEPACEAQGKEPSCTCGHRFSFRFACAPGKIRTR
eukprot:gene7113-biopygen5431